MLRTLDVAVGQAGVSVRHLCAVREHQRFSAALSNGVAKIYALSQSHDVAHLLSLPRKDGVVTDQCFQSDCSADCLFTCSDSGTLRLWDLRTGESVNSFRHGSGLTSLAQNAHVIAAGTDDGTVAFIDWRKMRLMHESTDSHASTITQVSYHPCQRDVFFSASEDGMLSVFDFGGGIDEDESFIGGQNWDAIEKFGFFGRQDALLWCLTAQHGLILWQWSEGVKEESNAGALPYYQHSDFRQYLSMNGTVDLDYCLGCYPSSEGIWLVGGDDAGVVTVLSVVPFREGDDAAADVRIAGGLRDGHVDCVRCCERCSEGVWMTGGEGSRICIWRDAPADEGRFAEGGYVISQKRRRERRLSPY